MDLGSQIHLQMAKALERYSNYLLPTCTLYSEAILLTYEFFGCFDIELVLPAN